MRPSISIFLALLPLSSASGCPLSDADFPPPSNLSNSSTIISALQNFTSILDSGFSTKNSAHGPVDPSSANAVQIFSLESESPLFEYYHNGSILSPSGVQTIVGDSIFRIGSVSKLVSVYMLLVEIGDKYWDIAITDIIPELRNRTNSSANPIDFVRWADITLGALAGQVAGLPRDFVTLSFGDPFSQNAENYGLPPLKDSEKPRCYINQEKGNSCDRTAFFANIDSRQPVYRANTKPIYSNTAFIVLGYALETISGRSYEDILQSIVDVLNLTGTSQAKPHDSRGVIPFNVSYSNWAIDLGDGNPTGGLYSSANDLSKLGRAILNNTLLHPNTTRAWLKPTAFTSDLVFAVGRPWEIYRADTIPTRGVIDIYAKNGNIGMYHTFFAVVPDYNIGIVAIVGGPGDHTWIRSSIVDIVFPALEAAAREQAQASYAGTYRATNGLNSSLTLSTSMDAPGLGITKWISNGTDMMEALSILMGTPLGPDILRIFPTNLEQENSDGTTDVSWRISFDAPTHRQPSGPFSACGTWFAVDGISYGEHGIDQIQFTIGEDGRAISISPRAFNIVMEKV